MISTGRECTDAVRRMRETRRDAEKMKAGRERGREGEGEGRRQKEKHGMRGKQEREEGNIYNGGKNITKD